MFAPPAAGTRLPNLGKILDHFNGEISLVHNESGRDNGGWIEFEATGNTDEFRLTADAGPTIVEQRTEGMSMGRESTQHKLDRVRSPRVQITYDVEVGGAIELKELPFVVGVLGDFTGQPEQPLAKLKDRKFVEVNPDNFDTVLEGMKPHLNFAVENKLSDEPDAANLKVDLHFKSMDDFAPENVAKQVKPLKELLDLRTRLSDLRGSLQGNDKLEEMLLDAVGDSSKLDKLKKEMGRE